MGEEESEASQAAQGAKTDAFGAPLTRPMVNPFREPRKRQVSPYGVVPVPKGHKGSLDDLLPETPQEDASGDEEDVDALPDEDYDEEEEEDA